MSWRAEWKAISDRILGLLEAARFYLETLSIRSDDMYAGARKLLLPQTQFIFQDIEQFKDRFESVLPSLVVKTLDEFIQNRKTPFSDPKMDSHGAIQFRLTALSGFRAELEYHISGSAEVAKRLSERAFLHIQRSIVADVDERKKWMKAFKAGEVACEKLGSVRLFQHGNWAFKVSTTGEQTDLIVNEPIRDLGEIERTADALVLTEWKLARNNSEVSRKVKKAKSQTKRYVKGALGGLELAQYRYIVILSEMFMPMPPDDHDGDVTYRHVNIVVDPSTPSMG